VSCCSVHAGLPARMVVLGPSRWMSVWDSRGNDQGGYYSYLYSKCTLHSIFLAQFSALTKALSRLYEARVSLVRPSPQLPAPPCGNASFFQVFGSGPIRMARACKRPGKGRPKAELLCPEGGAGNWGNRQTPRSSRKNRHYFDRRCQRLFPPCFMNPISVVLAFPLSNHIDIIRCNRTPDRTGRREGRETMGPTSAETPAGPCT
jgi:hypothetical protein